MRTEDVWHRVPLDGSTDLPDKKSKFSIKQSLIIADGQGRGERQGGNGVKESGGNTKHDNG